MAEQVLALLEPAPGRCYADATLGDGGFSQLLLEASAPSGRVLAVDWDEDAVARARPRLAAFGDRGTLMRSSFEKLPELLEDRGWSAGVDGVVMDLGVSSYQLTESQRGFSFTHDGPLDMRMDRRRAESAADLVNTRSEKELARILYEYGEERGARRVARRIVEMRRAAPLATTADLRRAVLAAGIQGRPGHDPATRSFQAFRIAVNDELGTLERFLDDGWKCLRPRGRLAVLAYHSLEDRLVKRAFRRWAASCICPPQTPVCACSWTQKARLLTKRPLRASAEEVAGNPRSRSARLRCVERI